MNFGRRGLRGLCHVLPCNCPSYRLHQGSRLFSLLRIDLVLNLKRVIFASIANAIETGCISFLFDGISGNRRNINFITLMNNQQLVRLFSRLQILAAKTFFPLNFHTIDTNISRIFPNHGEIYATRHTEVGLKCSWPWIKHLNVVLIMLSTWNKPEDTYELA